MEYLLNDRRLDSWRAYAPWEGKGNIMRQRACSFASAASILLVNAAPLPARSLEGTVQLVCQLQKKQTETRHPAPSEWSTLERVDVKAVRSKDQITISGTGSEINFSFSSVRW
jgi:hypothetical protein